VTGPRVAVVRRVLPAPPHVVFDEWLDASLYVTGRFLELDRPRRLRFSWSCSDWADPAVQSEVTVILEDHGADQTLMTIEHERLPAGQVDPHQRGWAAIAVQLGEALC